MSIETLKELLPDYAKDIKLNLSSLAADQSLTPQQLWGAFLASALASRNAQVIRTIEAEAAKHLSSEAQSAAKAAAVIMGMNNIYYRFVHIVANPDYQTMPAKLRMQVIGNPGVDAVDFELWETAVSAINGCGMCVSGHESKLLQHGMSKEQVQTAVRIASVVHAAAVAMGAEEALGGRLEQAA